MIDFEKHINRMMILFSDLNWKNKCDINEVKKILKKIFIDYGYKKEYEYPRVGVAVIIEKDNKVLLIKRKNSTGNGTWSFPGGKMEKYETIENTAIREAKEEVDLDIFNLKRDNKITNNIWEKEEQHYITFYIRCDFNGIPKIIEEDKCSDINWFDWNNLPENLFLPFKNFIN